MNLFRKTLLASAACAALAAAAQADAATPATSSGYKHVLLISVDGMHAVDLANWIQAHPTGNFAALAGTGIVYPNAFTTAPSDSYPGMLAQVHRGDAEGPAACSTTTATTVANIPRSTAT